LENEDVYLKSTYVLKFTMGVDDRQTAHEKFDEWAGWLRPPKGIY